GQREKSPDPLPVVREEPPGLVLAVEQLGKVNRSTRHAAELVALELWILPLSEEIARIEMVIAQIFEGRAVQLVGTALGYDAELASRLDAVVGAIEPGLDLEFLDRVGVDVEPAAA